MEIGIDDHESSIAWYVEYFSDGENILSLNESEKIRNSNEFAHLKYLYSNNSIKNLINNMPADFFKKIKQNKYMFRLIPNEIFVEIKVKEKNKNKYEKLENILKEDRIKLDKIVDIEFLEYYKSHEQYLKYLTQINDIKGLKVNRYLKEVLIMENKDFEYLFYNEDSSVLINYLNDNLRELNKDSFTSFLDTEKIHIQLAICSKDDRKDIPILSYFGYGNYYPFNPKIKNKDTRFNRFSQINNNDNIDLNYYLREFNKSSTEKSIELKSLIDNSQQNYFQYFQKNFNIEKRRNMYTRTYNSQIQLPLHIDKFMMLQPIWRNKFNSLIAYNYNFYNNI